MNFDPRSITSGVRIKDDALQADATVFGSHVVQVFRATRIAKIAPTVIACIEIDVIDEPRWPLASHVENGETATEISLSFDANLVSAIGS